MFFEKLNYEIKKKNNRIRQIKNLYDILDNSEDDFNLRLRNTPFSELQYSEENNERNLGV